MTKKTRLTETLEPADGDFVQFLKDLETDRGNLPSGLVISPGAHSSGIVTVSTRREAAQNADIGELSSAKTPAFKPLPKEPAGLAGLFYVLAAPLLLLGVAVIGAAIAFPEFDYIMPVGMFLIFAGTIGYAEAQKDKKRRRRAMSGR